MATNPFGTYGARPLAVGDSRFHLGQDGHEAIVHGSGWNAYIGPAPSPLPPIKADVGIGAALAVVLGAAPVPHPLRCYDRPVRLQCLGLGRCPQAGRILPDRGPARPCRDGRARLSSSATNYYLALATRDLRASRIDHEHVGIHNVTRSPVFTDAHAKIGLAKVKAVAAFLREAGVEDVAVDSDAVHESALWNSREAGSTDVLISAANEFNVRYHRDGISADPALCHHKPKLTGDLDTARARSESLLALRVPA